MSSYQQQQEQQQQAGQAGGGGAFVSNPAFDLLSAGVHSTGDYSQHFSQYQSALGDYASSSSTAAANAGGSASASSTASTNPLLSLEKTTNDIGAGELFAKQVPLIRFQWH